MATLLGGLLISLGLESGQFFSGLTAAQKEMGKVQKRFDGIGQAMTSAGAKLSIGFTAPVTLAAAAAVNGARAQAEAVAQVNAALTSMGGVAGRTSEQLIAASDAMEMRSLFDGDEILRKVTANLLTFGNVSGEVFDRAQQAALDMSARLGQDLQSSAVQLGKALNDPIKGVTALQKVGVSFSAAQRDQIKAMVAAGQTAQAQTLILDELQKQFGGAAEAAANTDPWRKAEVALGQAGDTIGEKLLPLIPPLAAGVTAVLGAFTALPEPVQTGAIAAVAIGAAIGPVLTAMGALVPLLPAVAAGFTALSVPILPIVAAAAGIAAAGYAIYQNWDKIGPVFNGVAEAFNAAVGPDIRALVTELSAAFRDLWQGPLGQGIRDAWPVIQQVGAGIATLFGMQAITTIKAFVVVIRGVVATLRDMGEGVYAVFTGDWKRAFEEGWSIFNRMFFGLPQYAAEQLNKLVNAVKLYVVDRLNAIWNTAKAGIDTVKRAFFDLYDAVVGNSYVPDMVDGIAVQMKRLDAVMVKPAQAAAARTGSAFSDLQQKLADLFDKVFPEARAKIELELDMETARKALAKGLIDETTFLQIQDRLKPPPAQFEDMSVNDLGLPDLSAELDRMGGTLVDNADLTKKLTKGIAMDFRAMAVDATAALADLVGAVRGGDWLDVLGVVVGALDRFLPGNRGASEVFAPAGGMGTISNFGGFRESGGPVRRGRSYFVGEAGPELFTPRVSGSIVPNDQLGGGGQVTVVMEEGALFRPVVTGIAGQVSVKVAREQGRSAAMANRQRLD